MTLTPTARRELNSLMMHPSPLEVVNVWFFNDHLSLRIWKSYERAQSEEDFVHVDINREEVDSIVAMETEGFILNGFSYLEETEDPDILDRLKRSAMFTAQWGRGN